MPQILVITESAENAGDVVYRETVTPAHFVSAHAGGQLVERLAWAVDDATVSERRTQRKPVVVKLPSERRSASA